MQITKKHKLGGLLCTILFVAVVIILIINQTTSLEEQLASEDHVVMADAQELTQESFDSSTMALLAIEGLSVKEDHLSQSITTNWHSRKDDSIWMDNTPTLIVFSPRALTIELETMPFDKVSYASDNIREEWYFNQYTIRDSTWNNVA